MMYIVGTRDRLTHWRAAYSIHTGGGAHLPSVLFLNSNSFSKARSFISIHSFSRYFLDVWQKQEATQSKYRQRLTSTNKTCQALTKDSPRCRCSARCCSGLMTVNFSGHCCVCCCSVLVPASCLSWLTDKAERGKDWLSQHPEQPRIIVCLEVGRRGKIWYSEWRSHTWGEGSGTRSVRCPVRVMRQGCLPRKGPNPAVPLHLPFYKKLLFLHHLLASQNWWKDVRRPERVWT